MATLLEPLMDFSTKRMRETLTKYALVMGKASTPEIVAEALTGAIGGISREI